MPRGHKGEPRTPGSGRKRGTPNSLTRTVKEAFEIVFNEMQGEPGVSLLEWGKKNPTDFYRIASKLIPTDMNASLSGSVKVNGRIEFI